MIYAGITEQEELYDRIVVDDRVFYKKKAVLSTQPAVPKYTSPFKRQKRYSDQFTDPVFIQKETVRRLKMIMSFREKNGDLDDIIARWRSCIAECIGALCKEHEVSPTQIFKEFQLQKHGFAPEDFDVDLEDGNEADKEEDT